jgi:hypothetical protein
MTDRTKLRILAFPYGADLGERMLDKYDRCCTFKDEITAENVQRWLRDNGISVQRLSIADFDAMSID